MKKLLTIILSLLMIVTLLPSVTFATGDEGTGQVEQEDFDYSEEDLLTMDPAEEIYLEDTSDMSTDEVTEIAGLETEEFGEDMELGLPDDEDFVEPEGLETESDENLDETDELNLDEPEDDEENEEGYEFSEDLTDMDLEEGDGSEEELGASGAKLVVQSRATVGVGKTKTIKPSFKGKGAKNYTMKIQDKSICTASWTKVNGKCVLNVTGKKAGGTYITIKLKGGFLSLQTLDKRDIRIDVPKLTCSPSTVTVSKGGAKKVTFSYANCVEKVSLKWSVVNPGRASYSWGNWNKKSVPLTVKGKNTGNAYIKVSLVDKKTGEVYATKKTTIIVAAQPSVKLSASKINVTAGKTSTIKVTRSNLNEKAYYTVGSNNNNAYSVKWGGASGNTKDLIITGKSKGSGKITIYLKSSATNAILASATATVNVSSAPKITAASTNIKVKTGLSTQVKVSVSGVSGSYYVLRSQVSLVSASFGTWSTSSGVSSSLLTIKGLNAGTQKLVLSLKDSKKNTLSSVTLNITVEAVAQPSIKLSTTNININEGRAAQITATVSNMPSVQKVLQYSYTDSSVCRCTADWSGKNPIVTVTGLRSGTSGLTITIRNKTNNSVIAQANATIKVSVVDSINSISYTYSNGNLVNAVKYPSQNICDYMFAGEHSKTIYKMMKESYLQDGLGYCFGMSLTTDLFYTPNNVYVSSFNPSKSTPKQLTWGDKNSSWGLTVGQWNQAMHISQFASECYDHENCSVASLISAIRNDVNNNAATPVHFFWKYENSAHTVLAYGIERIDNTHERILIYENNDPLRTQYIDVYKDSNGNYTGKWSYTFEWGLNQGNATLGYTTYANTVSLWNKHGSTNRRGQLNQNIDSQNLVTVNSSNFTVSDIENNIIAEVVEGEMTNGNNEVLVIKPKYEEGGEYVVMYLPIDVYVFENQDSALDKFNVQIANLELSTAVETTGDTIGVCADDSIDFASAVLDAKEGEEYSITLGSSREGDPSEIEWEGVGTGDTVSIMMDNGNLEMLNTESANLTLSEENSGRDLCQVYTILASADDNGVITPEGEDPVWEGEDQEYLISANAGYAIDDVVVDGNSVGAVEKYIFKDVHESHEIIASFKPDNSLIDIAKLSITALSDEIYTGKAITPKVSIRNGEYELIAEKDYTVSYSNNINVGKATITINGKGDYTGSTQIGFNIIKNSSSTIELPKEKVSLPAVKINKPKAGKKKVTVKWKKVSRKNLKKIKKIQIQYSTDKYFKEGVKTRIANAKKTSYIIKGLKAKKKYYVRIRAYKKSNGQVNVSKWSATKAIKVK